MDKQKLYEEISQLDYSAKIELIEALAKMLKLTSDLKEEPTKKPHPSLLELAGLGYETWKNVDAETYLREEKESWN